MINTTNTSANTEPNEKLRGTPSMAELDMRDYFAAKAMAAIIGKIPLVKRTEYTDGKAVGASENEIKSVISGVSVSAYEYADAMLAAREAGYALDDGCEPVEVEAALASRDAEIERLRHALELAVPVMDAHAGPSRLAEFVSAGRTAQAAREAFDEAAEMRRAEWHAEMRADAFGHPHE